MKFYYFPFACSLASHVVLEELGLPFSPVLVNLTSAENEDAVYVAINPNAAVPALQLDSGQVLTENIAILHWLADTHPEAGMWPESSLAKARALEWMSLLSTSFHSSARILWRTERYASSEEGRASLQTQHRQRYRELLTLAEGRFGEGPWVLGEQFSIADAHLLPYVRWPRLWKLDISDFPRLLAWHARMIQRPAVLKALEREGQRP